MYRQSLYLSSAGDAAIATAAVSPDWPTSVKVRTGTEEREIPIAYLDKDVIEEGDYLHPTTGRAFAVDAARIDHWVSQFNAMTATGMEVPAPVDHSKHELARDRRGFVSGTDNRGFIVAAAKVNVDGKARLRLTHQLYGEDAVLTAMRNRSSIYVDDLRDERGRVWEDVICHSAFTPEPVVSGMGSFKAFAASRDAGDVPIFTPAREAVDPDLERLRESDRRWAEDLAWRVGRTTK